MNQPAQQDQLIIVSSSPHMHSGTGIASAMIDVLKALLPALIASVYYFGVDALIVVLSCCFGAVISEAACQRIMRRRITVYDGSALLTGLLLALCLPPKLSWGIAVFGSVCAIVIGKQVFGGLGGNIFNPAHIGRAILLASFPAQMTTWTNPAHDVFAAVTSATKTTADAISSATPLALLRGSEYIWKDGSAIPDGYLPSLCQLFIGNVGGSLGETCTPALLLGGIYLIYRRHIDWRIPVFYIATVALICFVYGIFQNYPLYFAIYHILSGGLIIGAFFMATDWVTSPITKKGRVIFAIGLGILTALIRLRGSYVEGVCYSILIMNMLTPLIDRFVINTPFGGGKRNA